MQSKPANWASLFSGAHIFEYKFVIDGVNYTESDFADTPIIKKVMSDSPSIGVCASSSLTLSILERPGVSIPKAANVDAYVRLTNGTTTTDWLPQGRFKISKRVRTDSALTLTCWDYMGLANQPYGPVSEIEEFPAAMSDVVDDIASILDVDIDSRTSIQSGSSFVISRIDDTTTVLDVLSRIAVAHAGNWIFTESGKLRLIPLSETGAVSQALGGAYKSYTHQLDSAITAIAINDTSRGSTITSYGEVYVEDDTYSSTAPAGTTSASVYKIGGHSELISGSIVSAIVTGVKFTRSGMETVIDIPEEIRALPCYGCSAGELYNWVNYTEREYHQEVGSRAYQSGDEDDPTVITDGSITLYPLNSPVISDVSAYIEEGFLTNTVLSAGGTIAFIQADETVFSIPVAVGYKDMDAVSAGLTIEARAYSVDNGVIPYLSGVLGVNGIAVHPYTINGAFLDPCIELGDTISITDGASTISLLVSSLTIKCNVGYVSGLALTLPDDGEDEYPYVSATQSTLRQTQATIHEFTNTADQLASRYENIEGGLSELQQTVEGITASVRDLNGSMISILDASGQTWIQQAFATANQKIDINKVAADTEFDSISRYIRFKNGNIILGATDSDIQLKITPQEILFIAGDEDGASKEDALAYFTFEEFFESIVKFSRYMQIGDDEGDKNYQWIKRSNGHISLWRV